MAFTWRLVDASGSVLRATEPFATRAEAEAWVGGTWQELLAEGAESVALVEDDDVVYEMGLREA